MAAPFHQSVWFHVHLSCKKVHGLISFSPPSYSAHNPHLPSPPTPFPPHPAPLPCFCLCVPLPHIPTTEQVQSYPPPPLFCCCCCCLFVVVFWFCRCWLFVVVVVFCFLVGFFFFLWGGGGGGDWGGCLYVFVVAAGFVFLSHPHFSFQPKVKRRQTTRLVGGGNQEVG